MMKKTILLLLLAITFLSCQDQDDDGNLPATYYTIEGKWLFEDNSLNTLYIFENGIRYTYYCVAEDCEALYETFEAGDGNHIPGTNQYIFEDGILTIDLNFGNELVAPLTFECDGNKVFFESLNPFYLHRLNSDCD